MKWFYACLCSMVLVGCVTVPPPNRVDHICSIFKQYPRWYNDTKSVEQRWRVPVPVQMAIIHQESKFDAQAMPPRTRFLGLIPWRRPSTAYGYTQALTSTWALYKESNGGLFASRERFSDGVDFIGWYANMAHRRAGIARDDAYSLYLAYHEGVGGYMKKTYLKKPWLMTVAHKVATRARTYQWQLQSCHI